jgi:hypothetical protein
MPFFHAMLCATKHYGELMFFSTSYIFSFRENKLLFGAHLEKGVASDREVARYGMEQCIDVKHCQQSF